MEYDGNNTGTISGTEEEYIQIVKMMKKVELNWRNKSGEKGIYIEREGPNERKKEVGVGQCLRNS
jgi:hypothetical protein